MEESPSIIHVICNPEQALQLRTFAPDFKFMRGAYKQGHALDFINYLNLYLPTRAGRFTRCVQDLRSHSNGREMQQTGVFYLSNAVDSGLSYAKSPFSCTWRMQPCPAGVSWFLVGFHVPDAATSGYPPAAAVHQAAPAGYPPVRTAYPPSTCVPPRPTAATTCARALTVPPTAPAKLASTSFPPTETADQQPLSAFGAHLIAQRLNPSQQPGAWQTTSSNHLEVPGPRPYTSFGALGAFTATVPMSASPHFASPMSASSCGEHQVPASQERQRPPHSACFTAGVQQQETVRSFGQTMAAAYCQPSAALHRYNNVNTQHLRIQLPGATAPCQMASVSPVALSEPRPKIVRSCTITPRSNSLKSPKSDTGSEYNAENTAPNEADMDAAKSPKKSPFQGSQKDVCPNSPTTLLELLTESLPQETPEPNQPRREGCRHQAIMPQYGVWGSQFPTVCN